MNMIIHPNLEKLKNKLSNLIIEYEELKFKICPNMEIEYLSRFGFLEFELYKKDVELSKLKRKFQLIQIRINNQEEIDIDSINKILNEEFLTYEKNLEKQMIELDKLSNILDITLLSDDDLKKLKSLYKKAVLKLHPDLNENLSNHEKELFIHITEAFNLGDLETLELLYYSIESDNMYSVSDDERLKELIEDLKIKIESIKSKFPYNKKELLDDDELSNKYKSDLKNLIKQFSEEIQKYNDKIIKLI